MVEVHNEKTIRERLAKANRCSCSVGKYSNIYYVAAVELHPEDGSSERGDN
jgi:hypothetical protein